MSDPVKSESFEFQAEVSRLLHLMVHSVYSEPEVFLRELVSNAADACDKRRYVAQIDSAALSNDEELGITITADRNTKTITVTDNGIGMSRDELIENLGTIARSGTAKFMEQLEAGKDSAAAAPELIGQFGVGFYSVFMVAEKAGVLTRRVGEDIAYQWVSDGTGSFQIEEATREGFGTAVTLYLRDDKAEEFAESARLSHIVKTYSDHIPVPVMVVDSAAEDEEARAPKQANSGQALWTKPRSDISKDDYKEFYHHVAHAFDEPWLTIHQKAEGALEYTLLLFIPGQAPFDLYDSSRMSRLKLYVKRVFITQDDADLVPTYLRFLRGVVDCEDLPLNISREMLQNNPVLQRLHRNITNKTLAELKKKAEKDGDAYIPFWEAFGAVLKEGLTEDYERQPELLNLVRVKTTAGADWVSLTQLKERMKEGQKALYYMVGDDASIMAKSPHLEGFKARGIDVILLSDAVDSFWTTAVSKFDDVPLKSVTHGAADLDHVKKEESEEETATKDEKVQGVAALIVAMKDSLGEAVKDVVVSERLTDSPVCLVADEAAADAHMERFLKKYRNMDMVSARVLEINADHTLIKALAEKADASANLSDAAYLLLDQARIVEGEAPTDAAAFATRLDAVMRLAYA